jgi:tRNA-specific adenosine deaminase 2
MKEAFGQAEEALRQGETPVGAVFVAHPKLSDEDLNNGAKILVENWPYDFKKGRIVARGYNLTNKLRDATRHAEFNALEDILSGASLKIENDELLVLYVTVEPCVMCSFAMVLGGLKFVVFGCANDRFGGCGSTLHVHQEHQGMFCISGIMAEEAVQILKMFYEGENPNAPNPRPKRKKGEKGADSTEDASTSNTNQLGDS